MLVPIAVCIVLLSIVWLVAGIRGRSVALLLGLDALWFLGSLVGAYFTWCAWQDRAYSENWAMIGFMFCTAPYAVLVGVMLAIELAFIRRWQAGNAKALRFVCIALLLFLIVQLIVGIASA